MSNPESQSGPEVRKPQISGDILIDFVQQQKAYVEMMYGNPEFLKEKSTAESTAALEDEIDEFCDWLEEQGLSVPLATEGIVVIGGEDDPSRQSTEDWIIENQIDPSVVNTNNDIPAIELSPESIEEYFKRLGLRLVILQKQYEKADRKDQATLRKYTAHEGQACADFGRALGLHLSSNGVDISFIK